MTDQQDGSRNAGGFQELMQLLCVVGCARGRPGLRAASNASSVVDTAERAIAQALSDRQPVRVVFTSGRLEHDGRAGASVASKVDLAAPDGEGPDHRAPASARLEDDDRGLAGSARGPGVELVGPSYRPQLPQTRPLLRCGSPPTDGSVRSWSSTVVSGWACRFSHHAGSGSPQPFMAMVTRFGPSS